MNLLEKYEKGRRVRGAWWNDLINRLAGRRGLVLPASYIIFEEEGKYYAVNGKTGVIDYFGTDANTVIQSAVNSLTNGGKIFIKAGTYNISSTILIQKDNIIIIGEGAFYNSGTLKIEGTIFEVESNISIIKIGKAGSTVKNIIIKDLGLLDSSGLAVGVDTVTQSANIATVEHLLLENLWIKAYVGIRLDGYIYSKVSNTHVISVGTNGIAYHLRPGIGGFYPGNSVFMDIVGSISVDGKAVVYIDGTPNPGKGPNYDVFITPTCDGVPGFLIEDTGAYALGTGAETIIGGTLERGEPALKIVANVGNKCQNHLILGVKNINGILISGSGASYNMIKGSTVTGTLQNDGGINYLYDNYFSSVTIAGTGTWKFKDNQWFVTENSGTATIIAGNTYVDVTHDLDITPDLERIGLTPQTDLEGRDIWVSNATSTTFRINISSVDTKDNVIGWRYS